MNQEPGQQTILAVRDSVFAQDRYDWDTTTTIWQRLWEAFNALLRFFDNLQATHPIIHGILVVGLVLLLFAIIAHMGYLVATGLRASGDSDKARDASLEVRGAGWYLREARELAARGEYRAAIAHRFIAAAKLLGDQNRLRYHHSKTPLEYLGEIDNGPVRLQLAGIVDELYDHLFAGVGSDEDAWTHFDATASALEHNARAA